MSTSPFWVSAFLDLAPDHFEPGMTFWSGVTGYDVSPPRGELGEFVSLVPPDGDGYLRAQRLEEGADRIHLDLHVEDPRRAADRAGALGATEVADHGYVVMRSPGGLTFCFVSHREERRPSPTTWSDGHVSMLDQVCIDIPSSAFEDECGFWEEVTGRQATSAPPHEEFRRLTRPEAQALELLVQRLDEDAGGVRAHFDLATSDREAEIARHVGLGASRIQDHDWWTVMSDPVGREYCITRRTPR